MIEDKHTLRDLVLLAMAFRIITYEFGQILLEDLEKFPNYLDEKHHERLVKWASKL